MASVNEMGFNQVATTLNAIYQQATGASELAVISDTRDFISVAQTTLKAGYDNVMKAMSYVMNRTIFSDRPYDRKFGSLYVTNQQYGMHTRKINYIDQAMVDDAGVTLTDGVAVDQYAVRTPDIVQTNFYGYNTVEDYMTVYEGDIKAALTGPDELARFWSGALVNVDNKHKAQDESLLRVLLANFIAGKVLGDSDSVIHLLTEYNAATGLSLTATSVMAPANYKAFIQWAYARINDISDALEERNLLYHTNITGKPISRHTPKKDQIFIASAPVVNAMNMMALADVYHDNLLTLSISEKTTYWQSPSEPQSVIIAPTYMKADGTYTQGASTTVNNIMGVLFDREAIGISRFSEGMRNTPLNARGRYYDMWWNYQNRYWIDNTEKGVVFLLD